MANACDLECVKGVKGGPATHEFVGAVKIVLVDPSGMEYYRKTWGSAFLILAVLLMGATVFTICFLTMKFLLPLKMNLHVLLCTIGFQLFLPSGVMMLNSTFGGATYLKSSDKQSQHILLEVFAVITGVAGSALACKFEQIKVMKWTIHSYSGLLAALLILCSSVLGPCVTACGSQILRVMHVLVAVPAMILSTISFICGMQKESIILMGPFPQLPFVLMVFSGIYMSIVVFSVLLRLPHKM